MTNRARRVVLRYESFDQESIQLFTEPQDAAIGLKLGPNRMVEALVPLHIVNQKQGTVVAVLADYGDSSVLSFPPTNWGEERYAVDMNELAGIIVRDPAPTGG